MSEHVLFIDRWRYEVNEFRWLIKPFWYNAGSWHWQTDRQTDRTHCDSILCG